VVASNKALTSLIGASSDSNYGRHMAPTVIFPSTDATLWWTRAFAAGAPRTMADRSKVEAELESAMAGATMKGWAGTVFRRAFAGLIPRT